VYLLVEFTKLFETVQTYHDTLFEVIFDRSWRLFFFYGVLHCEVQILAIAADAEKQMKEEKHTFLSRHLLVTAAAN
jgi:hypothetical protein